MDDQIGPYRVQREIGRGGMGVVYLARDAKLERDVAIKALPEAWTDQPDRLLRFEREARSLAQLNHPNIAGIYGFEQQGGHNFLILEYVDGDTLADRIESGSLGVDETLELAVEIAAGVEAAHDAGVVHRDLKPENIKVTREGQVKVLDFGLATASETSSGTSPGTSPAQADQAELPTLTTAWSPTMPGAILGTPAYMSPEQARGRRVDTRTDVWSFGVVLYEMLTGTNPFRRQSMADSISAVLNGEIDHEAVSSSVPAMVRHVLRRCLERDRSRRWRSMADVRIELEDARSAKTVDVATGHAIVDRGFRLTDGLCKQLDREGFDPLVLGWEMQYADNELDSSVLFMWIPSFGGDHTTLRHRHLMNACPYRMVTPTPVGMEPHATSRPSLSVENQLILLRGLASELRTTIRPKHLIIGGSSCGAILALRCAAGEVGLFDGLLAIDPDLQESDCFVTRLFAGLDADSDQSVVDAMRSLSNSCESLGEWVSLHEYMAQCIEKMQLDLSPLIHHGRELWRPYQDVRTGSGSPFTGWLRDACDTTAAVRCVFPDNREKHRLVGEIRLEHLDGQCLGPRFNDDMFSFGSASTHFEMLRTEHMVACFEAFVRGLVSS